MEQDNQEQTFSKYNAGVAIQIRLDGLWKLVNNYAVSGNFKFWNAILDRIWSELARDIKENEYNDTFDKDNSKKVIKEGYKTQFDEFDKELTKLGNFDDKQIESFNKLTTGDITKRDNQYKILMLKDLFLKRLENHLGKGTAWDDKDEDDF